MNSKTLQWIPVINSEITQLLPVFHNLYTESTLHTPPLRSVQTEESVAITALIEVIK